MSRLSDDSDADWTAALAFASRLFAHHRRLSHVHELGTIMNEHKTSSILQRFSLILAVTTAYLGLPQAQAARASLPKRTPLLPHRARGHATDELKCS
jgi:hypothetical protein